MLTENRNEKTWNESTKNGRPENANAAFFGRRKISFYSR
jgi:hypothetical protein